MKDFKNENIGIRGVIEILKSKNRDIEFVRIPLFEISAKEFLAFAKSDFKEKNEKGLINALSNAKRAISLRMDEILKLSCLQKFSSKNRWNIPTKMDKLNEIGIFVPRLLQRKISSLRNLLEHEYIKPTSQEVEDIIDIVELFLTSTEKYIDFGFLGAINLIGRTYVIFNIVGDKIEIYREKQEEIIDLSKIDEKDLLDLGKELTVLKTIDTSHWHNLDMSWDDFYAEKVNNIRSHEL
jgi:hypothetical protein